MNKTSRYLYYSIITLVFATLLTPLIFSGSLFFPYITGKAFYFRTLVEIISALYVVLVCFDKSFLPKPSKISYALGAFLGIMALATIFSVAPAKSFWSNFERMEGYVTLIHLGLLFLVTSAVFNTRRLWVYLFHTSMATSIVVGLYALADLSTPAGQSMISGGRIQGPLGNSSYLGVYALFHIFLAAFYLLSHYSRKGLKDMLSRILGYALVIIFNVVILFKTGTRGAMVGLALGVLLASLLIAVFEKQSKKIRNLGIGVLVAAVLVLVVLGSIRGTAFVKNYPLVDRYSALVTFDVKSVLENQGYARAGLLWPMAWQGVEERPLFGWGQDTFGYVFAKHYNSAAYAQEQWFDRTHNVFFDWLIAGGFLGLIGYLALFWALLMVLWSKHPDNSKGHKWPLIERATMTGLMLAYFVHNFFVFDNLTSYVLFILLLAYFHERYVSAEHSKKPVHHVPLISKEESRMFVSVVAAAVLILAVYNINYKPYKNSSNLIKAIQALMNHYDAKGKPALPNPEESYSYMKGIFDSNVTLGLQESRERLVEISAAVVLATSTTADIKTKFDAMTRHEYAEQFKRFPGDPRYHYFLSLYLAKVGDINGALEQIKKAEALSPTKQQFVLQEGLFYFLLKQNDKASDTFKVAFNLEPKNDDARLLYAASLIYVKKPAEASAILAGSALEFDPRIIQAFIDSGYFDVVEKMAKKKIAETPNDPQLYVSLAALYLKAERNYDAINALRSAVKIEPRFKDQADQWIKMIQSGVNPAK